MNEIINYKVVLKVLGINLFVLGFMLLICTPIAIIFNDSVTPFIFSSAFTLLCGFAFFYFSSQINGTDVMYRKDAYLTVTLSWFFLSLFGCLPYIISNAIPEFENAIFESVSGFTTTGASILTNIEVLPKSILFWRSTTHWIGGIGIIVLVIVIMPTLKIGSYHLFTMESSLQEKIQPKIKSVGNRLFTIYLLLTIAQILLLMAGGMNWFESICHAFGTIATGGFSPKNDSIASYSPYIQYIIAIFMLLAGTNFAIHYYLLKFQFKKIRQNEELKFYLAVVLSITIIISISLFIKMGKPIEQSFREAFFQVVSIITCTGFASADYLLWPQFAWLIIFFSMFLGGCTGSTAGGIKMVRHLLLFKNLKKNIKQLNSRNAVILIRLNNSVLSDSNNTSILTFISVYLLVFLAGSIFLTGLGIDIKTASSSVATCMAGIGPGIGTVGPASNFAHLPILAKYFLTFIMIIGRLEIYTVLVLFTPNFWKK